MIFGEFQDHDQSQKGYWAEHQSHLSISRRTRIGRDRGFSYLFLVGKWPQMEIGGGKADSTGRLQLNESVERGLVLRVKSL